MKSTLARRVHTLVVDEAAQAVECETLLPLSGRPQRLLLVGDPQQLCATVLSRRATAAGFKRSLMQRLMVDCGHPHGFLDTQYRMHPEIAAFPTQRFYGGRLKTEASAVPEHGFFRFVDVPGRQRGGRGQSLHNTAEAAAVVSVVTALLGTKHHPQANPADVRVLTFVSTFGVI